MIIQDAHQLLIRSETDIAPGKISILSVEAQDTLEMVCGVLRFRSSPVAIVLPEKSELFERPEHFVQLRNFQHGTVAEEIVGFVIPANRLHTLARYANAQGFSFFSSVEKLLQHEKAEEQEKREKEDDSLVLSMMNSGSVERETEEHAVLPDDSKQATFDLPPVMPRASLQKQPGRMRPTLLVVLAFLVSATVLSVLFFSPSLAPSRSTSTAAVLIGSGLLSFTSSGQVNQTSSQGLNDRLSLNLSHLSAPQQGNHEYAWLLQDTTDAHALLLGVLNIHVGEAHLDYQSPQHTNLLLVFSRFRVTEQSGTPLPTAPSADPRTWRANGTISNIPTPGDEQHYSLLSHLRHLLAQDPTLRALGLSGGLGIWLSRNSEKLVEYASAARDDWSGKGTADEIHRHMIRLLDYLDGSVYAWRESLAGTPFLVDPRAGRIGLLTMTPSQNPPGILAHVAIHLQGLANAPGHTLTQQHLALQIDQAITTISALMQNIRKDAVQVLNMNRIHLQQLPALALLNDIVINATAAFAGWVDAKTGENTGGVLWICQSMQGLAVIPITTPTQNT